MLHATMTMTMTGILSAITAVDGHVYLMEPTSRNFFYTTTFQSQGFEGMTYCPHCLQSRGPAAVAARALELTPADALSNYGDGAWPHLTAYNRGELASNGNFLENDEISVRHGICGDPEQTAAEGTNVFGQENSVYPVLETYQEGSVVEMKVVISTYHWGHFEFHICNSEDLSNPDGPVTQGCFNMHPLDRAEDDGDASPIDPDHPGRYYLDPPCRAAETDQTKPEGAEYGYVVTGRYKLPEGLTCKRCIVQMVYYTGHVCKLPGYDHFKPDSLPEGCAQSNSDWINLDPPACGEGDVYPEEFWNCADIEIVSGMFAMVRGGGILGGYPEDGGEVEDQESSGGVNDDDVAASHEEQEEQEGQEEEEEEEEEEAHRDEEQENGGSSSCRPLEVLASQVIASASTQEANPAAHVLDGSLETRWSAEGSGSWLAIDLPVAASLSSIELAFEDGDERTQDFEIVVVSDTGVSTTSYTSSGETVDFQQFSLSSLAEGGNLVAKTVVIVGYGNSLNDWSSSAFSAAIG
eukprot:g7800.t1